MPDKKQPTAHELLASIEKEQMKAEIPPFHVGDTLDVGVTIREAGKERVQVFTGTCIARKGDGIRETFTVRRIVQGEGVERVFPLHSPSIQSIKVVRRGRVRRAKLHYLRERRGRSARLREDLRQRPEDKVAR
ncbi:MAG: 50S ribosomal protein L19 [Candidatus Brocadiaceae bacterium]|nr:50S ribosomal protein L19 [Candidatus Brocadiaceae bacterium]